MIQDIEHWYTEASHWLHDRPGQCAGPVWLAAVLTGWQGLSRFAIVLDDPKASFAVFLSSCLLVWSAVALFIVSTILINRVARSWFYQRDLHSSIFEHSSTP